MNLLYNTLHQPYKLKTGNWERQEITYIPTTTVTGASANNAIKKVIFKNCLPFTNCIIEVNNAQPDDAHDINVVKPM